MILILCGSFSFELGCASRPARAMHVVASGENLYRIGLQYGVSASQIAKANGIHDVRSLRVGQRLVIPRPSRTARRGGRPSKVRGVSGRPGKAHQSAREAAYRHARLQFIWPARGRLSSGFGLRGGKPHEGIDIAAKTGSMIRAAEGGRVISSGRMRGYGLAVVLKHAGSYRSIYAHASKLIVKKGELVQKGQKIAEVGSTGRSTGPHLHFEIRRKETPQNPMAFLPKRRR